MKIESGLWVILAVFFFFPSCLRLTTEIRLNADGTVNSRLVYILKAPLKDFGESWTGEEPWPIPLGKEYFVQRTVIEKDTELVSYKATESDRESGEISVSLKSASLESLARYLRTDITRKEEDEGGKLILKIPSFAPSAELNAIWKQKKLEVLLKESVFTIRIITDRKIKAVSEGTSTKNSAELELSLFNVLTGDVVKEWVVSWF